MPRDWYSDSVNRPIYFVTGTNTGVGKTVLTCLLARRLHELTGPVAALKPICSGGREDAKLVRVASDAVLSLDDTNPWHFRLPLTPLLAARRERRKLTLLPVVNHIRKVHKNFPVLIVEGAGGLLSPLGENFDASNLIQKLNAIPIVVCADQLGAINQVRLVVKALPKAASAKARIVLMSPKAPDAASRSNRLILGELFGSDRVHALPWLKYPHHPDRALADARIRRTLDSLI
jgi:dethiobiotin synthetase